MAVDFYRLVLGNRQDRKSKSSAIDVLRRHHNNESQNHSYGVHTVYDPVSRLLIINSLHHHMVGIRGKKDKLEPAVEELKDAAAEETAAPAVEAEVPAELPDATVDEATAGDKRKAEDDLEGDEDEETKRARTDDAALIAAAIAGDAADQNTALIPADTEGQAFFGDHDVLSGRGGGTNVHPGNRTFRELINSHRRAYLKARKNDKPSISRNIVRQIRATGGKFLKKDDKTTLWFEVSNLFVLLFVSKRSVEMRRSFSQSPFSLHLPYQVGDDAAREKTSQALRQRAPEMRKLLFDTEREEARIAAQEHLRQQRAFMGMPAEGEAAAGGGPPPGMPPMPPMGMPPQGMGFPPFPFPPPGAPGAGMPPMPPPNSEHYRQMFGAFMHTGGGYPGFPGGPPPMALPPAHHTPKGRKVKAAEESPAVINEADV
jgi:hypothetical protein